MRINGNRVLWLSAFQVYAASMVCAETVVLSQDTVYELPTDKSCWHNGDYTIESENASDLLVKGSGKLTGDHGTGKFISNGKAELRGLGILVITDSINARSDIGGGKTDETGYGYGGVFASKAEGEEDGVYFIDNENVYIQNVVYDASNWGQNASISAIYGGAIYAKTGDDVLFSGNDSVTLKNIGSLSSHDTNYSYKDFRGYGGAVHAEDLFIKDTKSVVDISDCYILQGVCTDAEGEGKGGAVYAHHLQISDNDGNVNLGNNYIHTANNSQGGALYITQSAEIKNNGLHVQISSNYVESAPDKKYGRLEDSVDADCYAYGGAIFVMDNAEFCIENNVGNISLNNNKAVADYSSVTSQGEGEEHMDDEALAFGGAVYLKQSATMSISHNGQGESYGNVEFRGNSVSTKGTNAGKAYGGAVYMESSSSFTVQGNGGNVSFSGNRADRGGVVYMESGSFFTVQGNGSNVSFSGNRADKGGAVYMESGSSFTVQGNGGNVSFSGNWADRGGAVYMESGSSFTLQGNGGDVSFSGNRADRGGAVYAEEKSGIFITDNTGGVLFSQNQATENGAALYAIGMVELSRNGDVVFTDNIAQLGSDIYAETGAQISILNNSSVSFVGSEDAEGNVIYLNSNVILDLNNNGEVLLNIKFDKFNTFVYAAESTQLNMCGNEQVIIKECEVFSNALIHSQGVININNNTAGVFITDNMVQRQGIIYSDGAGAAFSLSGNQGDIYIKDNFVYSSRGIIWADHADSQISICDNQANVSIINNDITNGTSIIYTAGTLNVCNNAGKVVFGKNGIYNDSTNTVVLKSISADKAYFSAAVGDSVELRDAVTVQSELHINANYNGKAQQGEVIFTGRYTDAYALEYVNNIVDKENSRFSTVSGTLTLHAGKLTVEHEAVLQAKQVLVESNKGAVISLAAGGVLQTEQPLLIGQATALVADAAALQLEDVAVVSTGVDELPGNIVVAGILQCEQLTLSAGSIYKLNGGILDLGESALYLDSGGPIIIGGDSMPVTINGEQILLLFCGVNECSATDAVLAYRGNIYTEEHIVFDHERGLVYLSGVVPEPGTAALSLIALGILMLRRKRTIGKVH